MVCCWFQVFPQFLQSGIHRLRLLLQGKHGNYFFPCHKVFSNSCLICCCLFVCFNIFNKCYHLLGCLVLHIVNKAKSFEGLGWCCLLLGIMKIIVFAWGRWAGAGAHIEMQNMCWGWAIYSSLKRRFGCWARGAYLVCRDSFLLPFSGP